MPFVLWWSACSTIILPYRFLSINCDILYPDRIWLRWCLASLQPRLSWAWVGIWRRFVRRMSIIHFCTCLHKHILSRKIKFADGLWPWCRCLWRFDAGNWIRPGSELFLIFLEMHYFYFCIILWCTAFCRTTSTHIQSFMDFGLRQVWWFSTCSRSFEFVVPLPIIFSFSTKVHSAIRSALLHLARKHAAAKFILAMMMMAVRCCSDHYELFPLPCSSP